MRPKSTNIVQEENDSNINTGMNRSDAEKLLKEHLSDNKNILHSRETEVIMVDLAKRLGKNEDLWGMVGLLHDIDWEKTSDKPKQHTILAAKILSDVNFPKSGIDAIRAHNFKYAKERNRSTQLDYALACSESITGIIYAAALVQPDKKLSQVKVKSIKKKLKDKTFAANVNREMISECEKLGLSLDEFIELSLKAMQNISDELGL